MSETAPHQAIYRRWRAQTFDQIVGQQAVVETLRNGVRSGRTAHAFLFVGPRGTGKTSLARILAKAINCTDLRDGEPCDVCPSCVAIREGRALDVSEMDAASNNTVSDMRELLPRVYTAPSDMRRKVFIIDEVQRITQGWDVLLKTLEEPPDHAVFIFCTTDSSQIRPAVLSRVQRFDFRKMTVGEISGKLRTILEGDGRAAEPDAIDLIARLAAGGMRDAESMLDQLLATDTGGALTADRVREVLGLVEEETIQAFLVALMSGDAVAGIELLDGLEDKGRDLRAFIEQAVERLRLALVSSLGRGTPSGLAAAGPNALAIVARRLAAVDPSHPGPGGLRLQLELALLAPADAAPLTKPEFPGARTEPPATRTPATPARPEPPAAARQESAGHWPASTAPWPEPAPRTGVTAPRPAASRPESAPPSPEPAPRSEPAAPARLSAPPPPSPASRPRPPALAPVASAPAEPSASPPAARTRNGPTLEMLLERWAEIVEVISKSPPTKPLIVACRPVSVDGAVVTLGFPEAQSFFKDVAERRKGILEDGVSRVLGMPVSVRCVAANVEFAPLVEDADGSRLLTEFKRIYGDDVVDVGDIG